MIIGTKVKIVSDCCYIGRIGMVIAGHALATRWMVLIDGDEVALDEFEMEVI